MEVGETRKLEIATGGRPLEAYMEAVEHLRTEPQLITAKVAHDDGCPCVEGGKPILFCTCEILELTLNRLA